MSALVECKYCQHTDEEFVHFCTKHQTKVKSYQCCKSECPDCEFKPAAYIPVGRCDECRLCRVERTPRAGYAYDYICTAMNKTITTYVEWDSEIPAIPHWCPFRVKEE